MLRFARNDGIGSLARHIEQAIVGLEALFLGQSDEVVLVHYEHQRADSPYRSSHAIYVREGEQAYDAVDQVPELFRRRMLSVRAFDDNGMMVGAELVDGRALEGVISELLADKQAAYLHAHFAKRGCYAARIDRA